MMQNRFTRTPSRPAGTQLPYSSLKATPPTLTPQQDATESGSKDVRWLVHTTILLDKPCCVWLLSTLGGVITLTSFLESFNTSNFSLSSSSRLFVNLPFQGSFSNTQDFHFFFLEYNWYTSSLPLLRLVNQAVHKAVGTWSRFPATMLYFSWILRYEEIIGRRLNEWTRLFCIIFN